MAHYSQLNKDLLKKLSATNALALVVFVLFFLTSNIVHANHIAIQNSSVEQQECYICHQGLDTPPELPQIQHDFIAIYSSNLFEVVSTEFKVSSFVQPQLRAPPTV